MNDRYEQVVACLDLDDTITINSEIASIFKHEENRGKHMVVRGGVNVSELIVWGTSMRVLHALVSSRGKKWRTLSSGGRDGTTAVGMSECPFFRLMCLRVYGGF